MLPADAVDELLPRVDILILTAPLTNATRHMIDARRLALLPKGAIVINVARGPLVVTEDLIAALESGHLGGRRWMSPTLNRCRRRAGCGVCRTSSSRRTSAASRRHASTT